MVVMGKGKEGEGEGEDMGKVREKLEGRKVRVGKGKEGKVTVG